MSFFHFPRGQLVKFLPLFKRYVADRRRRELDCHVCHAGREGFGKSSMGIQMALAVDPHLKPEDVILTLEDWLRVYDPSQFRKVYVLDEAARIFFNREWAKGDQTDRVKELMENRQTQSLFFWHLPQFKSLDKYAREGRIDLRTSIYDQGHAMLRELRYDAYLEEASYPIVCDDLQWRPLKETHPEFAKVYYKRKEVAHIKSHQKAKSSYRHDERHEAYLQARREERWRKAAERRAAAGTA